MGNNYNNIGAWLNGYLDAIQNGKEVTKEQLEFLISRVSKLIAQVEKDATLDNKDTISDIFEEDQNDDLPF